MREFIRHPSTIPVSIQLLGDHDFEVDTLSNVSLGGISCISKKPMELGSDVMIKVDYLDPDYSIIGTVTRCEKVGEDYELGVEFVSTKQEHFRIRMVEQICHIEHYKKEVLKEEGRDLSIEEAALEWIQKYAHRFPY